jgi:hypothetical protein
MPSFVLSDVLLKSTSQYAQKKGVEEHWNPNSASSPHSLDGI